MKIMLIMRWFTNTERYKNRGQGFFATANPPGRKGFKDSSEMLKNYKDLKVWQRAYKQGNVLVKVAAGFSL